jgi:hypothetical protein
LRTCLTARRATRRGTSNPDLADFEASSEELNALVARTVLEVLGYALTLRNAACVESALHGLGHLQGYRRGDVTPMIEDFIRRNPDLRPELLKYAEHAAAGCIQ